MHKITRRQLLTVSVGGFASLAGCQSRALFNSKISVHIQVANYTDENHEVWVQATSSGKNKDSIINKTLLMSPNSVKVVDAEVLAGVYQHTVSVNDVDPVLKKKVSWEIDKSDCTRNSSVAIVPNQKRPELLLNAQSCSDE
ncbi:hypothetical protein [Haladaptatus sp. W1]|uniref:hypothetical protein n=1 Tax=Haladaptatus sp. W1 TaxID=1897478 RepID=UPI001112E749|nr:hypothetical protein [Haladaptatus sp. W1]